MNIVEKKDIIFQLLLGMVFKKWFISMNSTLIAGSNGIVGSQLFSHLSKKHDVFGIGYEETSQNKYSQLDLTDIEKASSFVNENEHFSTLVFLTGLAHSKGKGAEYNKFYSVNVQTLVNLLEEMKSQNKLPSKIIFSSTISVYGEKYEQDEYVEDSELSPKSPYAKTKVEAEKYLLDNFKDISWILRFTPVYTPDFKLNIERRTRIKGKFYRIGKGKNKLSLLSIENIKASITAIIEEKVPAGIYNISDSINYLFNDLLKSVSAKRILQIPSILVKTLYYLNKPIGINFIEENSIKLLTDNLYPSTKIQKYVELNHNLCEKE